MIKKEGIKLVQEWDKTFPKSDRVNRSAALNFTAAAW